MCIRRRNFRDKNAAEEIISSAAGSINGLLFGFFGFFFFTEEIYYGKVEIELKEFVIRISEHKNVYPFDQIIGDHSAERTVYKPEKNVGRVVHT